MQRHVGNRHQGIVGWIAWNVRVVLFPNLTALGIATAGNASGAATEITHIDGASIAAIARARAIEATVGPVHTSRCGPQTYDLGQRRGLRRRCSAILVADRGATKGWG